MRFQNTPPEMTDLLPHEVIIVGTNTQGIHGAGLAKFCKDNWGLLPGISMGLCGKSYGVITKDLKGFNPYAPTHPLYKEKMIGFIASQMLTLYTFAHFRPDLVFYVTLVGCGLGGFNVDEIKPVFDAISEYKPLNICLPIEFE
jgi:hypothetical protein